MKQVVVTKPYTYEIRQLPIPTPKDNEVLIQMKAAGVCGSDIHIFKGENPNSRYPLVPGHENVGVVAQVGSQVTKLKPGDHVVVDLTITCGRCRQCLEGRKNVCETVRVRGSSADGGWQEYFTAPQQDVYPISPVIPWKDAALIEPFAIGGHCCKRGRVTKDDYVLILGTGTIGSIILQTCKLLGAKVLCADINDETLERAKGYGADRVVNTKKEDLGAAVAAFTGGHLCTVAFDSACFPGSLASLFAPGLMGNASRIVSLGFCTEPEPISQQMLDGREIDLIGSRMSVHQFEPTAKNMAEGKYNLEGLATTFIPFDQIERVFSLIEHPEPSVKKMVILFD